MKYWYYYEITEPTSDGEFHFSGVTDDLRDCYGHWDLSPDAKIITVQLIVKGKTYREKKDYLRWLAVRIYSLESFSGKLSYGELYHLEQFFLWEARWYGLVHEFEENGII